MRQFKCGQSNDLYELIDNNVKVICNSPDLPIKYTAIMEWTNNLSVDIMNHDGYFFIPSYHINFDKLPLTLYKNKKNGIYWLRPTYEFFDGRFQEITMNDTQEGGDHYKIKNIQPWDYIIANNLGFLEGNVVKYVTRYKDKNGLEDLKKARHYLQKLIEVIENEDQ